MSDTAGRGVPALGGIARRRLARGTHFGEAAPLTQEPSSITVGRCTLTLSNPSRNRACFQRLRLKCDESLSNVAFNFDMRCYTTVRALDNCSVLALSREHIERNVGSLHEIQAGA